MAVRLKRIRRSLKPPATTISAGRKMRPCPRLYAPSVGQKTLAHSYDQCGQHDSDQPNNSGEILKAPVIKKGHKKADDGARYANKSGLNFAHQCLSTGIILRQLLAECGGH